MGPDLGTLDVVKNKGGDVNVVVSLGIVHLLIQWSLSRLSSLKTQQHHNTQGIGFPLNC